MDERAEDIAGQVGELTGGQTDDDPYVDKLAAQPWTPGPGGVPLVDALPDRFAGRILSRTPAPGAHHVPILPEPVAAWATGRTTPPLRLHQAIDIDPGHKA